MRICLMTLCLCFGYHSQAQDWLLFPHNQINHYEYEFEGETYLDFMGCDSVEWHGDTLYSHLGLEYLTAPFLGECQSGYEPISYMDKNIYYEDDMIIFPELFKYIDGWEESEFMGNIFRFKNRAEESDAWG